MSIKESNLEISTILTVSTCHITEETCNWLAYTIEIPLCVYQKDYGFFIFVDSSCFGIESFQEIPKDLAILLQLAAKKGCTWLCLDSDGQDIAELPVYNW